MLTLLQDSKTKTKEIERLFCTKATKLTLLGYKIIDINVNSRLSSSLWSSTLPATHLWSTPTVSARTYTASRKIMSTPNIMSATNTQQPYRCLLQQLNKACEMLEELNRYTSKLRTTMTTTQYWMSILNTNEIPIGQINHWQKWNYFYDLTLNSIWYRNTIVNTNCPIRAFVAPCIMH